MKKLICGILMLGTIAGVYGQKVMSLEECRLLALENNKKLKMADEQINAAKAKKEEAFTKYLPALDAMGTYMRIRKRSIYYPKMPICLSVRSDKTVNGRSVKIRL